MDAIKTFAFSSVSDDKIKSIIGMASASAAAVGAGLAQTPGSDSPILSGIQTGMIVAIAHVHGVKIDQAIPIFIISRFAAVGGGRLASQVLAGWIPGAGNAINAATAAAITAAIGWFAHQHFQKGGD